MEKGCPKCGRMIDKDLKKCPYCNFDFKEMDNFLKKTEERKFIEEGKYAGFTKRLVAGLIDVYLVSALTYGIMYIIEKNIQIKSYYIFLFITIFIIIYILTNSLLERTGWHGSVGKRIVNIEVFDQYENPQTFPSALIRNTVKIVNILTLGIGFIICAGGDEKRTLGDIITKNYCLNKINFKQIENKNYASPTKRLIAFLLDTFIISLIILGLNYLPMLINNTFSNIPEFIKLYEKSIIMILSMTITLFYFPFAESKRGKTYGKKIMKIKLVDEDENVINFPMSFIRQMLIIIDIITLGFLLSISDVKRQTIKDKITKTIVVND